MNSYSKGEWIADMGSIVAKQHGHYKHILSASPDIEYNSDIESTEAIENAERAALCVNFLEGWSNEDLTKMVNLKETLE